VWLRHILHKLRIITPHRSTTYVHAAWCYRPSSVVCPICLTVSQSVTLVSPAKTVEATELPFGLMTRVGPRNRVGGYIGSRSSVGRAILRGKRSNHCKVYAHCAVICAKTSEPINLPFGLCTQVGRRMHRFSRIRQMVPMCHHGRTHCRHLANAIEPSVFGRDALYVKLL